MPPSSSPGGSPEVSRGVAAIKANDFKTAKAALEKALEKNPKDGTASYYLGVSLENLGDKQGAEKRYQDAIAYAPDLAEASINLGALYLDMNRPDDAITVTRAALVRRPTDPVLHANLAFALRAKGDKEGAAAEYQKASGAMNDNPELRVGYAELLLDLGRKDQAAAELKRTLDAAGSNRPLLASVGRLLGAAGAYADCVAAFDRAIAAGDHAELRVRRGVCRHELKDEAGAKADYEAALKLDPKFPPAHYYLGESLLDAGKKAEGIKELDLAAAAAPTSEIGKKARERADSARHAGKKK
jgi:Flp pilus assembly protein TadD